MKGRIVRIGGIMGAMMWIEVVQLLEKANLTHERVRLFFKRKVRVQGVRELLDCATGFVADPPHLVDKQNPFLPDSSFKSEEFGFMLENSNSQHKHVFSIANIDYVEVT